MTLKDSFLLSIVIPTYNRPSELKQCLESISYQSKKHGFQVSLDVRDNSTCDDSIQENINNINVFRQANPSILVRRHDVRNSDGSCLSGDENIYKSIRMKANSSGYRLVLPDDDILLRNAFEVFEKAIISNPSQAIFYLAKITVNNSNINYIMQNQNFPVNPCVNTYNLTSLPQAPGSYIGLQSFLYKPNLINSSTAF